MSPTLAVLVPLVAALIVAAVSRSEPALARGIGVLGALVELVVLVGLVWGFDPAGAAVQGQVDHAWLPAYGVEFSLGVDGGTLWLLVLVGLVVPLALMSGDADDGPGRAPLVIGILILEAAWVGVLSSRDLVSFAGCWALALMATLILVAEHGDGRMGQAGRSAAARRHAAHLLPSGVALLLAVVLLGVAHAHASGGSWSWSFDTLSLVTLPADSQYLGFALVVIAVAGLLPLIPLVGGLSRVCVSGPTPVVILILGVGMPMGVFVLGRVGFQLFPLAAGEWADPLAALAVAGGIWAGLACWAEREPGRLLAHLALLHLCSAIVGVVSGSATALGGLGPYLLAHGLGLAVLTIVFHSLRRDRLSDLGELAGWGRSAPRAYTLAILATLSLLGAPGSVGFIGSLGIVTGVVSEGGTELLHPVLWSTLAFVAVGLGGLGVLRSVWYAGRGQACDPARRCPSDLGRGEQLAAVGAVVVVVGLGIAPAGLLNRGEAARHQQIEELHMARCLAAEARAHPRAHTREEFGPVCLDPVARLREIYRLEGTP